MRLEHFQMIDEVIELDRGRAFLAARSRVPESSPVFEGHFPGHALMPGVLLVETMAQASGYLLLARNEFRSLPILAGIQDAKLRQPVVPGAELTIEASVVHDGSGFAVMRAQAARDGASACNAVLKMRSVPFPSETVRLHIQDSAEDAGLFALEG